MLLVFQTISYEAPPFSDDEKVDDFDDFWPLTIFRQRLAWHSVTFHSFNWSGGRFCSSSPIVFYSPSCRFFGRFGAASLQQLAWHSPWHDCHGWRDIRPFVVNVACREFLDFFPAVQNKKPCKTSHMLGADWRGSCAQGEVVSVTVGIWVIFCLRIRWPILLLFSFVLLSLVLDCMQIKYGITLSWDGFVS